MSHKKVISSTDPATGKETTVEILGQDVDTKDVQPKILGGPVPGKGVEILTSQPEQKK